MVAKGMMAWRPVHRERPLDRRMKRDPTSNAESCGAFQFVRIRDRSSHLGVSAFKFEISWRFADGCFLRQCYHFALSGLRCAASSPANLLGFSPNCKRGRNRKYILRLRVSGSGLAGGACNFSVPPKGLKPCHRKQFALNLGGDFPSK